MKFSVLIVSPPGYPHSACFREVAETLCHGLRELGYVSSISDQVEPGARHIVLGSNLLPFYPMPLPADSILYNLEQLEGNEFWGSAKFFFVMQRFPVWDYSNANVPALAKKGIQVQAIVPISYFDGLSRIDRSSQPKDIDVLFVGSMNERRNHIISSMRASGLNTVTLFNKYGPERDAYLARAKLMLNVHFYPAKILEEVRISYYLANRLPVLSEHSGNRDTDAEWSHGVFFADYEHLASHAVHLCKSEDRRAQLAEEGFRFISKRSIRPHLKKALSATMPVFHGNEIPRSRNEPCFCGSGRRYKHCHGRL
jgi:hypothetical protein